MGGVTSSRNSYGTGHIIWNRGGPDRSMPDGPQAVRGEFWGRYGYPRCADRAGHMSEMENLVSTTGSLVKISCFIWGGSADGGQPIKNSDDRPRGIVQGHRISNIRRSHSADAPKYPDLATHHHRPSSLRAAEILKRLHENSSEREVSERD